MKKYLLYIVLFFWDLLILEAALLASYHDSPIPEHFFTHCYAPDDPTKCWIFVFNPPTPHTSATLVRLSVDEPNTTLFTNICNTSDGGHQPIKVKEFLFFHKSSGEGLQCTPVAINMSLQQPVLISLNMQEIATYMTQITTENDTIAHVLATGPSGVLYYLNTTLIAFSAIVVDGNIQKIIPFGQLGVVGYVLSSNGFWYALMKDTLLASQISPVSYGALAAVANQCFIYQRQSNALAVGVGNAASSPPNFFEGEMISMAGTSSSFYLFTKPQANATYYNLNVCEPDSLRSAAPNCFMSTAPIIFTASTTVCSDVLLYQSSTGRVHAQLNRVSSSLGIYTENPMFTCTSPKASNAIYYTLFTNATRAAQIMQYFPGNSSIVAVNQSGVGISKFGGLAWFPEWGGLLYTAVGNDAGGLFFSTNLPVGVSFTTSTSTSTTSTSTTSTSTTSTSTTSTSTASTSTASTSTASTSTTDSTSATDSTSTTGSTSTTSTSTASTASTSSTITTTGTSELSTTSATSTEPISTTTLTSTGEGYSSTSAASTSATTTVTGDIPSSLTSGTTETTTSTSTGLHGNVTTGFDTVPLSSAPLNTPVLIGSLVGGVGVVVGCIFLGCFLQRKRKEKGVSNQLEAKGTRESPQGTDIELSDTSLSTASSLASTPRDFAVVDVDIPAGWFPVGPLLCNKDYFSFGPSRLPVDEPVSEVFILRNCGTRQVVFAIVPPAPSHQGKIAFSVLESRLEPAASIEITVTLTILCMCKMKVPLFIRIDGQEHLLGEIQVESELSSKLDFTEIFVDAPPIGEGNFGVVYKGLWRARMIAVKRLKYYYPTILSPASSMSMSASSAAAAAAAVAEHEQEFQKELHLMSKLRHPNIVEFVGAVATQGQLAICTEFVPLGSLRAILRPGKLSFKLKMKIAVDTAQGMAFLHACGIIHRDLKPENILITSLNEDVAVNAKLSDFGTSKAIKLDSGTSTMTKAIGTPLYMAPEILQYGDKYSLAVDVFSFGVLLWELYTEHIPYSQFIHSWDVAHFVVSGQRLTLPDDCPDLLQRLIKQCWSQNPKDRPTFANIVTQLETILNPPPLVESPTKHMTLSDFALISMIGKGGYGEVFLCREKETGEVLCIKRMKKEQYVLKNDMTRIQLERKVMVEAASSPWIIFLKYSFQDDEHLYFVMEFAPGGDLSGLIAGIGGFEENEARLYVAEIVCAVEYLHSKGFVHRDIKPNNFVISATGHLKLIDFGLSQEGFYLRLQETMRRSQTSIHDVVRKGGGISAFIAERRKKYLASKSQEVVGSPDYIAPEVLLLQGYDFRVDWWAVGCIVYELLLGFGPFQADDAESTLQNVRSWKTVLERPMLADGTPAISDVAWDLIISFLTEQDKRLGRNGIEEIKQHPFFDGLDWDHLLDNIPSVVPKLTDDTDSSYFDAVQINPAEFTQAQPPPHPQPPIISPPVPMHGAAAFAVRSPFIHLVNSPAPLSPRVHLANFTYNSNLEVRSPLRQLYNSPR